MARAGRDVWAKRVERWKDSGLTAKEFAAETGINVNSLTHWRWRLAHEARSAGRTCARPTTPTQFVELVATADQTAPAAPRQVDVAADPIEVVLRGGVRLVVPVLFDETALRRLVGVLEAR